MVDFDCSQIENYEDLRKLQSTMLEMLKLVDKICREHDIQYSLCSGTLLGAVRHKGFIPWDDDLDIRMTRENYDRFLSVWNTIKPDGYFLQNKENSPKFSHTFTKIRKNHTTFVQIDLEEGLYHNGIFVDVFPLDRIPNGKFQKAVFRFRWLKYLIYTRENFHLETNSFIKAFISFTMKITRFQQRMKYREKFVDRLRKIDQDTSLNCIGVEMPSMLKIEFPSDVPSEYIDLTFEDGMFMCFKNWDAYLKALYGDYMLLPPKENRTWFHHPVILDFEHNYEELPPEQRKSGK